MENSRQIAWKIVPLRHYFPLKLVPLIEVLLYIYILLGAQQGGGGWGYLVHTPELVLIGPQTFGQTSDKFYESLALLHDRPYTGSSLQQVGAAPVQGLHQPDTSGTKSGAILCVHGNAVTSFGGTAIGKLVARGLMPRGGGLMPGGRGLMPGGKSMTSAVRCIPTPSHKIREYYIYSSPYMIRTDPGDEARRGEGPSGAD
jgi:hypothetical protein